MWRVMRDKLWATSMKNGEMKVASTAFTFTWYPTLQKKYHKQRKISNTSAWMMQKSTETLSKITPKMRKYTAHSERTWSVSLIQIFSSSFPIFLQTLSLKKLSPFPLRFFFLFSFSLAGFLLVGFLLHQTATSSLILIRDVFPPTPCSCHHLLKLQLPSWQWSHPPPHVPCCSSISEVDPHLNMRFSSFP